MKDDIKIKRLELYKMEESKAMLDRVMKYLDNNHFNIYMFIIRKEMELTNKRLKELAKENDK